MKKGMEFDVGLILRSKDELIIGQYYYFYKDIYLYCGNIPPFENAHAFACVAGTLYVNNATIKELLENKELRHATRAKIE